MPVYVIDTIKPKNGGGFPIVEAIDVYVEGYTSLADAVSHFATQEMIEEINTILIGKADAAEVSADIDDLQAQIDQIVISASAESVVAPEVAAARVGADSTSYQTLKARLDAENNQLKNEVSDLADRVVYIPVEISESMFEKGSINSSGGDSTFHEASRCRMKDIARTEYDMTVSVSGAYFSVVYYTASGEYIETVSFTNTALKISKNRYFKLLLTIDPNQDNSATIHEIYSHFTFTYDSDIVKLQQDVIRIDEKLLTSELIISEEMFEKGNINASGQNTSFHENSRCRLKSMVKSAYTTTITVSGAYHSIILYDDNGDFDETIPFSNQPATIPKNKFFRLILTIDPNRDDLASISDICSHFSLFNNGIMSVESETANAKTDSDGNTYQTLKLRLDTENTEIKNEISDINKRLDSVPSTISEDMFEKGSISANGQNSSFHESSRCRMKNNAKLAYDTTINSDGAYHSIIYYDENGDATEAVPFSNKSSVIPRDRYFRLILTINPNRDDLASVEEIYSHFTFLYSSNDVPDEEAVDLILAANRHFDTEHTGTWDRYDFTGLPTFLHLTDIHEDSKRFDLFRRFAKNSYVTKAICTGDIVNTATVENVFDFIEGATDEIMFVVGNHDREGITKEEVKSYLMPNRDNTYYYVDFDDIRIIVLDQLDQADDGTSGGIGQYTQTQIDWFINVLKNSAGNYHVLVAMHCPEKTPVKNSWGFYQRHYQWTMGENEYIAYSGGTVIEDIINAYKNGESLSKEYRTVTVETSFPVAGDFIAYMVGHYHADMIGYSQEYSDQIYLLCDQGRCTSNSASDLARYEGFKSQNCFNAYVIDTQERKIKVIRVGADHNDILEKRKTLVLEYN